MCAHDVAMTNIILHFFSNHFVFVSRLLYHTNLKRATSNRINACKHSAILAQAHKPSQEFMTSNSTSVSTRALWRYGFFNLVILVLIGLWFWQQNKPVMLADAQLPADGKLQCVSYAPYYGVGQSPFIKGFRVSQAQIDSDLQLLAKRSQCVRIYSVSQGLDYVPEAASKIGLKVLMGAWIGWVKAENEIELDLAIKRANEYPGTVTGLVVGNEVLLRGEQTEKAMADYLHRAKQATKVPVTYADVWEFWLKHRKLESSVDFVTVHVLPYWEDDPQPVSNALNHVNIVMEKITHTFSKPILIGETGWPSAGRHRNGSVPSAISQASYMRGFLQHAHEANWNYNVIEAVDQPWKRVLEGAVGGYWGLYDTDLNPKFPFSGMMAERNDGCQPFYWAFAGLLLWLAIALVVGERRIAALFGMVTLGASAGAMAMLQLDYLVIACRDSIEWIALGGINLVGLSILLFLPALLTKHASNEGQQDSSQAVIRNGMLILVIGTAIAGLLLVPKSIVIEPWSKAMPSLGGFLYNLDGRYRDFPLSIYLLPVLQLSLGLWLLQLHGLIKTNWRYYRHINLIALITMGVFLIVEPLNQQAYIWLILVILLAFSSWPVQTQSTVTPIKSA